MFKMVNKRLRNRKGFTLIELVVVIAILGILAIIAIPRFTGMRANANLGAIESNLRNVQNAAEVVAAEENKELEDVTSPEALEVLGNWPEGPGDTSYDITTSGNAIANVDGNIPLPDGYNENNLYFGPDGVTTQGGL